MAAETHSNGPQLDDEILADPEVMTAIKENGSCERRYDVNNVQRTLLGRVAGCVAKHHGDFGFSGSLKFNLFVSFSFSPSCLPEKPLGVQQHLYLDASTCASSFYGYDSHPQTPYPCITNGRMHSTS